MSHPTTVVWFLKETCENDLCRLPKKHLVRGNFFFLAKEDGVIEMFFSKNVRGNIDLNLDSHIPRKVKEKAVEFSSAST